ncbi:MAG: acetate/propionate family kinase [Alphaproteobacteria bacterium]
MTDESLLLTFNAGSSTVKIGFFEMRAGGARRLAKGDIDFHETPLRFRFVRGSASLDVKLKTAASDDLSGVLSESFGQIGDLLDLRRIAAVGHRVVHGGDAFDGPVRIDDRSLRAIDALTTLAPLHQPQSLRLIRAIRRLHPEILQTASFDTAFHRTNDETVRRFAIPRALHDRGIKRYGFHGLSYKFIAGELARRRPDAARGKLVIAHLGSGASLCALDAGASRDTSMGFSTLDGIPMATRCGALDPGVVLHLLGAGGYALTEVEDILYHRSGLLGVSSISSDSRELLQSSLPAAREAVALFAFRIAGEIARLATSIGGVESLVFTAGIGEHQAPVRAAVARHLAWLGLALDAEANRANAELISASSSRVAAFVIPTDEEQVIADEALAVLRART